MFVSGWIAHPQFHYPGEQCGPWASCNNCGCLVTSHRYNVLSEPHSPMPQTTEICKIFEPETDQFHTNFSDTLTPVQAHLNFHPDVN